MVRPRTSEFHGARWFSPRPELRVGQVQPFGAMGVGLITNHPVGLVLVAAVFLLAVEYVPPARWFIAASLLLGGLIGLFLWLRHR